MTATAIVLPYSPEPALRAMPVLERLAEVFAAQPVGEQVNVQVSTWLKLGFTLLAVGDQLPGRGRAGGCACPTCTVRG